LSFAARPVKLGQLHIPPLEGRIMLRAMVWALVLLAPLPAARALQDSKGDEPQKNKEAGKTVKGEDRLAALQQQFQKEVQGLNKEYVAAKTDKEKEQVLDRFFEVLARHAEGLTKFLEENHNGPAATRARQELLQNLASLGQANSPAVAKTLRKLLETTTQKDLKGQLALAVGQSVRAQAERAYQKKDRAAAEKLMKEAQDLLHTAKEAGGPTASQADDALYLLENLSVGKAAPEIAGEDLDGKKFKLSDYRGKVVVLDFWGNW
jgi:hypothetical protein